MLVCIQGSVYTKSGSVVNFTQPCSIAFRDRSKSLGINEPIGTPDRCWTKQVGPPAAVTWSSKTDSSTHTAVGPALDRPIRWRTHRRGRLVRSMACKLHTQSQRSIARVSSQEAKSDLGCWCGCHLMAPQPYTYVGIPALYSRWHPSLILTLASQPYTHVGIPALYSRWHPSFLLSSHTDILRKLQGRWNLSLILSSHANTT
jgi:hypothetical protein